MRIWKYPLEITDSQSLKLPLNAKFLSAINQNGIPTLYYLVEPDVKTKTIEILIIGTGNPISEYLDKYDFLGTVSTHNDKLVWHIFATKER